MPCPGPCLNKIVIKKALAIIMVALLLSACSSSPVKPHVNAVVLDNVPFFPQEDYQCGPASLAGVLHYWGSSVDIGEIANAIFSKSARGTLTIDMVLYAERLGYSATQYSGSLDDLRSKIRAGYPLVVLVDYGIYVYRVDHFMDIIGYDDNGVIVNSVRSEKIYLSNEDFLKSWKRTNNWTLWIKPKGKSE
ncbi:MAG TPA: C39 family peptidase [Dissulfurispiraceae bacterium]|nr:C39 family peptidase [Dissulfurispiraceae bacterium]